METTDIQVTYNLSTIHFLRFGTGSEVMIAFHGFGEISDSFLALQQALGGRYTVYAMDMPYHGKTIWREPHYYNKQDLHSILELLFAAEHISKFELMGFSMGGKNAMAAVKMFPDKVQRLLLLASDGIQTKRLYNVAVYPAWGRKVFHSVVHHPGWLFAGIRLFRRLGIISPWLHKFTTNHLNTKEKRQCLYDTWVAMADFQIDIPYLKQLINKHAIPVLLIFGERDEVIPPAVATIFAQGVDHATIHIIRRGHYFIDERFDPVLTNIMSP